MSACPFKLLAVPADTHVSSYNELMGRQRLLAIRSRELADRGFTLTELAVVLAILSLLFVFLMPTSVALLNNQKRELTRQKLKVIESALVNFVAVNKRLPCPALGDVATGTAGAGSEGGRTSGDCTNSQATGVVPWLAIGVGESDITDGWNRRITYRAAYSLTRDNVLDMTNCDPAGTKVADTTSQAQYAAPAGRCDATCVGTDMSTCTSPTNYLAGKGFDVRDGAGTTLLMSVTAYTGAAFVLISHGENGYGAYAPDGNRVASPAVGVAGTIEEFNVNGPTATVTSTLPLSANTFRESNFSEGDAASYFDDTILRPGVFSIIQRAQLGPRSH